MRTFRAHRELPTVKTGRRAVNADEQMTCSTGCIAILLSLFSIDIQEAKDLPRKGSTINPGMKFIASSYGLQYGSYMMQQKVDEFLLRYALPKLSIHLSGTELMLSNVTIKKLYRSHGHYDLLPPGCIRWVLSQKKVRISGLWQLLRCPCVARGDFNVTLLDLKTHIWQTLCDTTRSFLMVEANKFLNEFPTTISIDPSTRINFDVGLIFSGYPIGCVKTVGTSCKLHPPPLASPSTNNSMYYFLISDEVFNALFVHGFKSDAQLKPLHKPVRKPLLGSSFKIRRLPGLPELLPIGRLSTPPSVTFVHGHALWNAQGTVDLISEGKRKSSDSGGEIRMKFNCNGSFVANAKSNKIRPSVNSIETVLTVHRVHARILTEAKDLPALKTAISDSLEQVVNSFLHRYALPLPLRKNDVLQRLVLASFAHLDDREFSDCLENNAIMHLIKWGNYVPHIWRNDFLRIFITVFAHFAANMRKIRLFTELAKLMN
ncbi:unnamed protein product [Soboliphyme baturini]|uniref:PNPLA domain-containing protein n=1 Tax=Soboliphyme baturini TaxID=241478 RepID=A0A183IJV7_9BILA|nr:unnamed protein product [Soboliphyme baturini]